MLPKIWFIQSYSLMLIIAFVMAIVVAELYLRKFKLIHLKAVMMVEINGAIAIFFGLIGANLVQNLYDYIENPATYSYSLAMTFYGGLIFGIISFLIGYYRFIHKKYPFLIKELLIIAPASITVAHAFGRVGCFLNGCCYGHITNKWYGLYFPNLQQKVIPTNLYEALFLFLLSALLLYLAFKKKGDDNLVIYLASYGLFRFLIEFLRADHRGQLVPYLSPSQFVSLLAIIAALIFWIIKRKKRQISN